MDCTHSIEAQEGSVTYVTDNVKLATAEQSNYYQQK